MAKYYGRESGYLKRKRFKFRLGMILTLAAVLAVAAKILTMDTAEYWLLIVAGLALFIYPLILMNERFNLLAFFVSRGLTGETVIREELLKLPDSFAVFEDLTFPHARGNIDFAVTGPSGVFAIEVKSHRGRVEHHKGRLYVNGYSKRFLEQTLSERQALKDYLDSQGVVLDPVPVLVFSSKASLKFGFEKVGGVYVFGREYLTDLLVRGGHVPRDSSKAAEMALLGHYLKHR
ncbi:MAG: nuclease-related domain-containing protein [Candidatus Saccharibacteria bacterium]